MSEDKKKDFINKMKSLIVVNKEKDSKKKIESLVVFIIILIITVILINMIWNEGKEQSKDQTLDYSKTLAKDSNNNTNITNSNNNFKSNNLNLEEKLEDILQNIEGVGKVKVLLTYSESQKTLAMYNEDLTKNDTEEVDTNGGNRKITQSSNKKEVIYEEINGKKVPVTQSIIEPKIEGAIITAVGARNSHIKECIVQAVEAATGLKTHKIQVFEMVN